MSLNASGMGAGATVSVALSDAQGLLSASGAGVAGSGTRSLTIAGPLAQVNADLATLTDIDAIESPDTIAISATDGPGGAARGENVLVTVNGLPQLALPSAITIGQGQRPPIGARITELGNTAGETFTVTLNDTGALLSASGPGVSGTGTARLVISGSLSQVNTDLATLAEIDPTAATGAITATVHDSLGNTAVDRAVAVTRNGLPELSLPVTATVGQGRHGAIPMSLSETGNTGAETFVVTLTDSIGLLSASGPGVRGGWTTQMTLSGSLTQVDALLATVVDVESAASSDTITVSVRDSLGNTSGSSTIAVTVNAPPQLSTPAGITAVPGQPTPIVASLSETGNTTGETFRVTLRDGQGLLSATGAGVTGSGTTSLTIAGSLGQVNADLATLNEIVAPGSPDTITLRAFDSLGNSTGNQSVAVGIATVAANPPAGNDTGGAAGQGGSLLPAGYLSTHGNQIVDAAGNPVRIASIGWDGTDSLTFAPYGLWQSSLQQNIDAIKADGFNTIRIPWTDVMLNASPLMTGGYAAFNPSLDPELVGKTSMQLLQQLVQDAGNDGLKVILDHHDDDGGPGGWGGQQANGLWIDSGPGTNGTDGSGTVGTVTAAKFLADSVSVAKTFAGNATVIGFDLDNEPTSAGNINWGQGGPTDIQAMYTQVGDAVQAVDPGALIIAEGPEEWSGPAPGMPAGFAEGDLSGVAAKPVTLTIANKVVYSVHEYPPDLSGNGSYDVAQQAAAMNAGWGYLETDDTAPVWVGEIGSNMTSAADQGWIQGVLGYMNGADAALGGPAFSGTEQPVSGSWWQWGSAAGQDPEGVETAWGSGVYWPAQQVATDQLLYKPSGAPAAITVPASGGSSATMQFLSPSSGSVVLSAAAYSPTAGTVFIATISNLGAAPVSGWAVELDTTDVLANVAGGLFSSPQSGVHIVTASAQDAQIAPGGYVSFSFSDDSQATISPMLAHLVQLSI